MKEMTQIHINKFPTDLKQTMETWGDAQMPEWTLRQIVITACQEWADRNMKPKDERQTKIIELERQLEALKRETAP